MKIDLSKEKNMLEELKKAIASMDMPLEIEIKDDKVSQDELDERISNLYNQMWRMYDELYNIINSANSQLWDYFSKHNEGHLPPIPGADKMAQALEILKLSDDYKVEKRYVYASTGKREEEVLEFRKKIKDKATDK